MDHSAKESMLWQLALELMLEAHQVSGEMLW